MKYWDEYLGHEPIKIKNSKIDNNIYTFDIETSSYLILDGKQIATEEYLKLSKKEQEECKFQGFMYIWMFGINDTIYYGRTWQELVSFMFQIDYFIPNKKIIYVHNLSFEFQFLRNIFKFKNVLSRKSHKVMKCEIEELNFEFRCTYYMTNAKLEKLPKIYGLNVKKLVGNLDYSKVRTNKTKLYKKELEYCENDCLVLYEYIKKELEIYKSVKRTPLTSTGHVRKEFKEKTQLNFKYKYKVKKASNTNGHIYNLLLDAFAGGYTHSNWIFTGEVIKNITSYDFTSSYPYVMVTHKFPMKEFKKCYIKSDKQLLSNFAYLLKVRFKNIECKYYNTFISQSKCLRIKCADFDNGRVIRADELEIVLTDIDFKFILKSYTGTYEILESYYSLYGYLPKEFIEFILEKYKIKTEYKGVKDKELEYNLEKAKFNSLYGMCVTNNIKDKVEFDNLTGWNEVPLENEEIIDSLEKEKEKGFLSFSWGVWVTSHARNNLLKNVIKLDKFCVYCDTDSLKLREGFDINVIETYNKEVEEKIKKASHDLGIPIEYFKPKDIKGKERSLGIFDKDAEYTQFITQGAKKYAYIDKEDYKIHITVAGVPKKGANALKRLEDFQDDFVFDYKDTGKNLLIYNDDMEEFEVTDYKGEKQVIEEKYACVFIPTTYVLGKSEEYMNLLSDESSKRAIFKE